ncbi:DegV family protein [Solimonas terrae]|uniref:DegV family EDD domain-containing protein n=1 Tax=Solimonas terrae TaxID=1396819 RepID=A0A6M2BUG1_9GAMM|nr:DegV family protein [Solimonas terrae]NGY06128.1 DegV family EDD domain-containing protein [Solimonas terrae]
MRIGVVVDSACDLPMDYLERHRIQILPITIHLDGHDLVDQRDAETTLRFYREHLGAKGDAGSSPFSVEQIRDVFLSKLVLDYDYVFCLTIASSRSPINANATQASFAILNGYKPIRAQAGIAGPFALRVIDTQNLFVAQAISTVEVVRMIEAGQQNPNKIRERAELIVQNTYGYMVPRDLHYLRVRGQKKGDRSVGWFGAALGTMLDIKPIIRGYRNETGPVAKLRHFDDACSRLFAYAAQRVVSGLLTPTLGLCYGGELGELRKLPGYGELLRTCRENGIEVLESVMSVTGGINVGEGALGLAFAAEPHDVDI